MSEYQYYEFLAIDRPLTSRQVDEVRAFSTRAAISSTSFVNEYHWGSFKGDPEKFIERYFDIFLYYANWGTRTLMMGLPTDAIEEVVLERYCAKDAAWFKIKKDKLLLGWEYQDEEGGGWEEENEASMGSLAPLREELLRGDYRSLYLGWLLSVQSGEVDEADAEPPVPRGLGSLSAAQTALMEFLRIDEDLLDFAARASEPFKPATDDVNKMVSSLSPADKDELLARFLRGDEPHLPAKVRRQLAPRSPAILSPTGRTAGELIAQGEIVSSEREAEEQRLEAEKRALREAAATRQRIKDLDALAARGEDPWNTVEELVSRKNSASYDEALKLLVDLRDLATRTATADAFARKVRQIVARHAKKLSFVQRVKKQKLI